ncbi:unnamed protein product [Cuscuta campestris]|uniref:Uncharacterized protein n=1 Tax=Cuscuta campestris TaxID=132261 RepID=A0A484LIQ8_9ASTE|nr:unnamed protein product [Cuscuta campestris]
MEILPWLQEPNCHEMDQNHGAALMSDLKLTCSCKSPSRAVAGWTCKKDIWFNTFRYSSSVVTERAR